MCLHVLALCDEKPTLPFWSLCIWLCIPFIPAVLNRNIGNDWNSPCICNHKLVLSEYYTQLKSMTNQSDFWMLARIFLAKKKVESESRLCNFCQLRAKLVKFMWRWSLTKYFPPESFSQIFPSKSFSQIYSWAQVVGLGAAWLELGRSAEKWKWNVHWQTLHETWHQQQQQQQHRFQCSDADEKQSQKQRQTRAKVLIITRLCREQGCRCCVFHCFHCSSFGDTSSFTIRVKYLNYHSQVCHRMFHCFFAPILVNLKLETII